ncbi:TMEM175 family protein [Streptomyces sp. NPDC090306]|uniref:TMEM175 family protein n=1 Tax=unclassified Streptomyces TaxID=2593676 RepID=UPI0036E397AA
MSEETVTTVLDGEASRRDTERTLLFTDAVVAIAITLLALDLPVPHGATNTELWHSAREGRSEYQSFLISFLVIFAFWRAHRQVFGAVGRLDRTLGMLNGLWLLLVIVMPFATKVLAGDGGFELRFGFYALLQSLTSLVFVLVVLHTRRAGLHVPGTPRSAFTTRLVHSASVVLCFAVSVPVSIAVGEWAYFCWAAIPFGSAAGMAFTRRRWAAGGQAD